MKSGFCHVVHLLLYSSDYDNVKATADSDRYFIEEPKQELRFL